MVGEVATNEGWKSATKTVRMKRIPKKKRTSFENKFEALAEETDMKEGKLNMKHGQKIEINQIDGKAMTRVAQLEFIEADVRKPLASAMEMEKM